MSPRDPRDVFSPLWSARERIALVVVITTMIREDIEAGRYGRPGRPNIQSIHEMLAASPEELEKYRARLDEYVDAFGRKRCFDWLRASPG